MSIVASLVGPVTGLLDKFIEDKDQKNALAHEIATMSERHAQELMKGQLDVNKTEAAHKSLFVAGWRPSIGVGVFAGLTLQHHYCQHSWHLGRPTRNRYNTARSGYDGNARSGRNEKL